MTKNGDDAFASTVEDIPALEEPTLKDLCIGRWLSKISSVAQSARRKRRVSHLNFFPVVALWSDGSGVPPQAPPTLPLRWNGVAEVLHLGLKTSMSQTVGGEITLSLDTRPSVLVANPIIALARGMCIDVILENIFGMSL